MCNFESLPHNEGTIYIVPSVSNKPVKIVFEQSDWIITENKKNNFNLKWNKSIDDFLNRYNINFGEN